MSLALEFEQRVLAGVAGMLVQSADQADAIREIQEACRKGNNQWPLAEFDFDRGVVVNRQVELANGKTAWRQVNTYYAEAPDANGQMKYKEDTPTVPDAFKAIRGMGGMLQELKTTANQTPQAAVLLIKNPRSLYNNPAWIQLMVNRLHLNKSLGLHIVILAVDTTLPPELRRLFEAGFIRHNLPDKAQIAEILTELDQSNFDKMKPEQQKALVDAASGLTHIGVEDAAGLSLVRHKKLDPRVMFDLKAEAFAANSSGLTINRGGLTFADYGGAQFLKQFCLELLTNQSDKPKLRPKGLFLLGPPGVGKSLFAKCLGNETNRATALMELGAMKSKMQGESFANLSNALETLEAMAPVVAMFDEVEGQLSGGKGTGSLDAGTQSQGNSKLLTWLNDKTSDVFCLCCCNDIRILMNEMPEFTRMGRFDGMFFLDYPSRESKDEIWKIHLVGYELIEPGTKDEVTERFAKFKVDQGLPDDPNWTGSEIEACCRLSAIRRKPLKEVGEAMATISDQASELIAAVRNWAKGKCYAAEYEGLYDPKHHETRVAAAYQTNGSSRRRIITRAGNN